MSLHTNWQGSKVHPVAENENDNGYHFVNREARAKLENYPLPPDTHIWPRQLLNSAVQINPVSVNKRKNRSIHEQLGAAPNLYES